MPSLLDRLPKEVSGQLVAAAPRLGFQGYYRLLGLAGVAPYALAAWNEFDCWRFAWPHLSPEYLFFGFSAWGDQYAIDVGNICRGILTLDAFEMSEDVVAPSLETFLAAEFGRLSSTSSDSRMVSAYAKFGPLKWDEGLALVPPLLFSPSEEACEVIKTNMRTLMIINGDVYSQWLTMGETSVATEFNSYTDSAGRERLRIRFLEQKGSIDNLPE